MNAIHTKYNSIFWFHLFITVGSWFLPILFDWKIAIGVYCLVLLQFVVLNRCILNKVHDLNDDGEDTFYAHLLELMGFQFKRSNVRKVVRFWIYIFLAAFTLLWQFGLGHEPLVY
jgi:hypothetical protein